MSSIDSVIAALLAKKVSIEVVAKTIGTLKGKKAVAFEVQPADKRFLTVAIGAQGEDPQTAEPEYVDFSLDPQQSMSVAELHSLCSSEWHHMSNTPEGSPYLYACPAKGSTSQVSVNVSVTLSEDIHVQKASVVRLLLQRGVW